MNVLGVVAEYNPFHKGHLYHINESKKLTGAQAVVAVMSGNFVQRGEPAIINKWARTEMALRNGADLVLELPCIYASASAEYFAFGAISLLDSTRVINYVSFGSESGNINELMDAANVFSDEPEQFKSILRQKLDSGMSYAKAREEALREYMDNSMSVLKKPNNILAVEYLKALNKIKSTIKPVTVKRMGSDYNSSELDSDIPSATAIRNFLIEYRNKELATSKEKSEFVQTLLKCTTSSVAKIIVSELAEGRLVSLKDFEKYLICTLRIKSPEELCRLPYISEGLENRIKNSVNSGTIDEFLKEATSSRYPTSRFKRILTSLLTGVTADNLERLGHQPVPYIKVLGFNQTGRTLLSSMSLKADIPVITKAAKLKTIEQDYAKLLDEFPQIKNSGLVADIESISTDIYTMGYSKAGHSGIEYTTNPIIL